jgi:hypothetical protein
VNLVKEEGIGAERDFASRKRDLKVKEWDSGLGGIVSAIHVWRFGRK